MFTQRLREAPLCNSRQLGQFSLRDILIAKGELTPADESDASSPEMSVIEAAFEDTGTEELQEVAQATDEAIGHLEGIDAALASHVEPGAAPDLSEFQGVFADIRKHVQGYLAKRGVAPSTTEGQEDAEAAGEDSPGGGWSMGEIRSREDVLAALEKVCRYYEQHEPSSPVPLLVRRAKRLVAKSFVEIIRDLSPETTKQIENIGGIGAEAPAE